MTTSTNRILRIALNKAGLKDSFGVEYQGDDTYRISLYGSMPEAERTKPFVRLMGDPLTAMAEAHQQTAERAIRDCGGEILSISNGRVKEYPYSHPNILYSYTLSLKAKFPHHKFASPDHKHDEIIRLRAYMKELRDEHGMKAIAITPYKHYFAVRCDFPYTQTQSSSIKFIINSPTIMNRFRDTILMLAQQCGLPQATWKETSTWADQWRIVIYYEPQPETKRRK